MLRNVLDKYERKARLAPAMLTVLPIAVLVAVIATTAGFPALAAVAAAAIEFGVPVAMSNYTRSAGKAIEARLWASWGGPPTTARLRHRDSENEFELAAIHAKLQQLVPEVVLPSREDERISPDEADRRFDASVKAAIPRLRDNPVGRLLFEENCAYGFWRNSLALRPVALGLAVLGGITTAAVALVAARSGDPFGLAVVGTVAEAAVWLYWRSLGPTTVKRAAAAYAAAFTGAVLGWSARTPSK